jgi:hypothetical protein
MNDPFEYFSTLAKAAGVEWCPLEECDYLGSIQDGIVHMTCPKRFTKRSVYFFLHHAFMCTRADTLISEEKYRFQWAKSLYIREQAEKVKTRLPRSLFELDRARLREALSEYASRVPKYARPADYDAAKRWAR